jgi:hypothetical protein
VLPIMKCRESLRDLRRLEVEGAMVVGGFGGGGDGDAWGGVWRWFVFATRWEGSLACDWREVGAAR